MALKSALDRLANGLSEMEIEDFLNAGNSTDADSLLGSVKLLDEQHGGNSRVRKFILFLEIFIHVLKRFIRDVSVAAQPAPRCSLS